MRVDGPRPPIRGEACADIAAALGLGPRPAGRALIVAFVGAGGKTSSMFAVAASAAGESVTLTTTTRIRDPRLEAGRWFGEVVVEAGLRFPPGVDDLPNALSKTQPGDPPLVVASEVLPDDGKLCGIHPLWTDELARRCDLLLVEADGSRGRSIKAPAAAEPVMPLLADVVIGLVGLDCLGAPMGAGVAHRPELLASLVGCAMGETIEPRHVLALAGSRDGLFKDSPGRSRRILLLNKADAAPRDAVRELLRLLRDNPPVADLVLACSLLEGSIEAIIDFRGRRS